MASCVSPCGGFALSVNTLELYWGQRSSSPETHILTHTHTHDTYGCMHTTHVPQAHQVLSFLHQVFTQWRLFLAEENQIGGNVWSVSGCRHILETPGECRQTRSILRTSNSEGKRKMTQAATGWKLEVKDQPSPVPFPGTGPCSVCAPVREEGGSL